MSFGELTCNPNKPEKEDKEISPTVAETICYAIFTPPGKKWSYKVCTLLPRKKSGVINFVLKGENRVHSAKILKQ